jgi:hypothetical protein
MKQCWILLILRFFFVSLRFLLHHFAYFPFVFASDFSFVGHFFSSFSLRLDFFASFPLVFASDFCHSASMWKKRNHAFLLLQFEFSLPKRKWEKKLRRRSLVLFNCLILSGREAH